MLCIIANRLLKNQVSFEGKGRRIDDRRHKQTCIHTYSIYSKLGE